MNYKLSEIFGNVPDWDELKDGQLVGAIFTIIVMVAGALIAIIPASREWLTTTCGNWTPMVVSGFWLVIFSGGQNTVTTSLALIEKWHVNLTAILGAVFVAGIIGYWKYIAKAASYLAENGGSYGVMTLVGFVGVIVMIVVIVLVNKKRNP